MKQGMYIFIQICFLKIKYKLIGRKNQPVLVLYYLDRGRVVG